MQRASLGQLVQSSLHQELAARHCELHPKELILAFNTAVETTIQEIKAAASNAGGLHERLSNLIAKQLLQEGFDKQVWGWYM